MKSMPRFALLGTLLAVSGPSLALQINFGLDSPPLACAAASSGIGSFSPCGHSDFINQAYGDVADLVDVNYAAPDRGESLRWWSTRYNNLYGVAFAEGNDGDSFARIELRAQGTAHVIELLSFDLGAYADATRDTNVRIYDLSDGSVLFSALGISVGTFGGQNLPTPFAPQVRSSTGVAIEWFNSAYNVGIDNIDFNVVTAVPEPESYAMLLAGLGLIGALARRRR